MGAAPKVKATRANLRFASSQKGNGSLCKRHNQKYHLWSNEGKRFAKPKVSEAMLKEQPEVVLLATPPGLLSAQLMASPKGNASRTGGKPKDWLQIVDLHVRKSFKRKLILCTNL